ncbi:MAG: hypothetical protein ABI398_15500 [Devosia sp.]
MRKSPEKSHRRSSRAAIFTTSTIISFSLTLLAAGIAVLTGLIPLNALTPIERIEIGSLLFLMPVVALVLGVCFEVARIALRAEDLPEPRQRQQLRWEPGRREG